MNHSVLDRVIKHGLMSGMLDGDGETEADEAVMGRCRDANRWSVSRSDAGLLLSHLLPLFSDVVVVLLGYQASGLDITPPVVL